MPDYVGRAPDARARFDTRKYVMDSHQPPQGQLRTIVGFHLDEQLGMGRKSKTGGMAFKPSAIFSATQTATPSTQAFGQDLRPTANSGGPLRERFSGRALP